MNLTTWRDDAQARGLADADHVSDLARRLHALAETGDPASAGSTVRWVLRHLVCPA